MSSSSSTAQFSHTPTRANVRAHGTSVAWSGMFGARYHSGHRREPCEPRTVEVAEMATEAPRDARPLTVPDVRKRKSSGTPLVMVTAYDAPTARVADAADVDLILVGDSLAMVVL